MKTLRLLALFTVLLLAALPSFGIVICGYCDQVTHRCVRANGTGMLCFSADCSEQPSSMCDPISNAAPEQFAADYAVASVELVHN
jgi:hypothetical protein